MPVKLKHILGFPRLRWLIGWLVASWALVEYGMVLLGPTLSPAERWAASLIMLALGYGSLVAHNWAHQRSAPTRLPLTLFGEPAQLWPAQAASSRELLSILAGPLLNALLGLVAVIIWNQQLQPVLNAICFGLALINAGLALINLLPAFPLDGGRFLQALLLTWLPVHQARRIVYTSSFMLFGAFMVWGLYLISLRARFSLETGMGLIVGILALALGLRYRPAVAWTQAVAAPPDRNRAMIVVSMLVFTLQIVVVLGLLPMVDGMYAPGPAVAIGPMISIPAEKRSDESRGALLLTTVITQTPITLGQWLWAQISPAYLLVPPERVVPADTSPQQLIQRNVAMLEESEATALVVGSQLAGYQAELTSTALQITTVAPESPSAGLLLAGDIIKTVNGVATPNLTLLRAELSKHKAADQIMLEIEREGQQQDLTITLMAPAENSQTPRIGVNLQALGLDAALPFPITITTQKIVGGPSAGLMFSLAVYDALTPGDLTHGRRIAGTGTISLDGTIGPIGGIEQKVAGAEWAGAEYFIVPREHEAAARKVASRIKLIPVSTAQEAIQALQALP